MFEEYKIKIKDGVIKVYTDGIIGTNFLFSFREELLPELKLTKELRKAIISKEIELKIKQELKLKPTPGKEDNNNI